MSLRSAELHAWRSPVNQRWTPPRSASDTHANQTIPDEPFQLGDSAEGCMAQLNPTSDTDTTAAIHSDA